MPTYDLLLLLKKMPEAHVRDALKRMAGYVFETGGVLRKMENLGFRQCPYRLKGANGTFKEAHYFLYKFDASDLEVPELREKLLRDRDLVRQKIYFVEDKLRLDARADKRRGDECNIDDDTLDVPFRPHVQQMVELSKKRSKRKEFHYGGTPGVDPLH